ncbi:hypothetical protein [Streptomyces canus]|uniref:hypothetical protein n=1 Tax=Streptomyces canus TaxID=58343 RepID=UPI0003761483|nr:hypothetical protein [Streptomyces canus]
MLPSETLANISTLGLHEERAACLQLTDPSFCSDSVIEFHADLADRISDEIDSRNT